MALTPHKPKARREQGMNMRKWKSLKMRPSTSALLSALPPALSQSVGEETNRPWKEEVHLAGAKFKSETT